MSCSYFNYVKVQPARLLTLLRRPTRLRRYAGGNELQDLIPGLLKASLALLWANRWDWFFGVDIGIYYESNDSAIMPDGFLSIGNDAEQGA